MNEQQLAKMIFEEACDKFCSGESVFFTFEKDIEINGIMIYILAYGNACRYEAYVGGIDDPEKEHTSMLLTSITTMSKSSQEYLPCFDLDLLNLHLDLLACENAKSIKSI